MLHIFGIRTYNVWVCIKYYYRLSFQGYYANMRLNCVIHIAFMQTL